MFRKLRSKRTLDWQLLSFLTVLKRHFALSHSNHLLHPQIIRTWLFTINLAHSSLLSLSCQLVIFSVLFFSPIIFSFPLSFSSFNSSVPVSSCKPKKVLPSIFKSRHVEETPEPRNSRSTISRRNSLKNSRESVCPQGSYRCSAPPHFLYLLPFVQHLSLFIPPLLLSSKRMISPSTIISIQQDLSLRQAQPTTQPIKLKSIAFASLIPLAGPVLVPILLDKRKQVEGEKSKGGKDELGTPPDGTSFAWISVWVFHSYQWIRLSQC